MRVGINYPWRDYGWDIGEAPPSWRPAGVSPAWSGELDADLEVFRSLGIRVVRWFILGDGLTCGTGADAPRRRPDGTWGYDPVPLGVSALTHFAELLSRFERANVSQPSLRLLPVLLDFHACLPGCAVDGTEDGWVKGGRAEAVADAQRRTAFLDGVLEPLLAVSLSYRRVIYAWEVMNEPEWVTHGWHPTDRGLELPVSAAAMGAFLGEAQARIRRAGFRATVGFASAATLQASGIASDVHQFHHYPDGRAELPRHTWPGRTPAIVGEFATAPADVWPELGSDRQGVEARLRLAKRLGYPLAMLWSYRQRDRHSDWTHACAEAIRGVVGGGDVRREEPGPPGQRRRRPAGRRRGRRP